MKAKHPVIDPLSPCDVPPPPPPSASKIQGGGGFAATSLDEASVMKTGAGRPRVDRRLGGKSAKLGAD